MHGRLRPQESPLTLANVDGPRTDDRCFDQGARRVADDGCGVLHAAPVPLLTERRDRDQIFALGCGTLRHVGQHPSARVRVRHGEHEAVVVPQLHQRPEKLPERGLRILIAAVTGW